MGHHSRYRGKNELWLGLMLLYLFIPRVGAAAADQYLFLNRTPGLSFDQNRPETINDALFTEPRGRLQTAGTPALRLGVSFVLSYLNGPPDKVEATLKRLLEMSEKHEMPVLIVLDGENWWDYRSDLWNWWDTKRSGYDPRNVDNVEWIGPTSRDALKGAWRNWGRQIRVIPPPNLASPRFREASRQELRHLAGIIKRWADRLPAAKRFLFPGVKIGWEASVGINAFAYPNGNTLLEQFPDDASHDPQTGLEMQKDFAGGLLPPGYAALRSMGRQHAGPITLVDQERITADYLAFLSHVCRQVGFKREQIFTHAGGQFAPWTLHYSHQVAVNRDSLPGWSLYGTMPADAGDLSEAVRRSGGEWAAAEWLPYARTAAEWEAACNHTLGFQRCRLLSLYNWEGIRDNLEAVEGLRRTFLNRPKPNK